MRVPDSCKSVSRGAPLDRYPGRLGRTGPLIQPEHENAWGGHDGVRPLCRRARRRCDNVFCFRPMQADRTTNQIRAAARIPPESSRGSPLPAKNARAELSYSIPAWAFESRPTRRHRRTRATGDPAAKCANRLPSVRVLDSCRGSSEPPGPSRQTEYDEGPVCGVHTHRRIACLAGPSTRTDGIRACSRVLDSPASCCLRGSEPGDSPDIESDSRLVAPGRDAAVHDAFGASLPSHKTQSPCFRHVLMR